jgi:uncharacterized membrane protein (UPF0127 family)
MNFKEPGGKKSLFYPLVIRGSPLRPFAFPGRRVLGAAFFLAFFLAGGGISGAALGNKALRRFEIRELTIERSGAPAVLIKAELARTEDERAQGLMNRKNLPDGEGMFFVFDRDQILSFWMKNTLIPLSIAFIASDGRILEIRDMEPGDLKPLRSSRSARYAMEVPQKWFNRMGITAGDRVRVGDI